MRARLQRRTDEEFVTCKRAQPRAILSVTGQTKSAKRFLVRRCCRDIAVPHHVASPDAPAHPSEPVRVVSSIVPGNTALEIAKREARKTMAAARDTLFNAQVLVRAVTACIRIGIRIKEDQAAIRRPLWCLATTAARR